MTWREDMDQACGRVVKITVARAGDRESMRDDAAVLTEDVTFVGELFAVRDDGEAVLDPCEGGVPVRSWVWPVLQLEILDPAQPGPGQRALL